MEIKDIEMLYDMQALLYICDLILSLPLVTENNVIRIYETSQKFSMANTTLRELKFLFLKVILLSQ